MLPKEDPLDLLLPRADAHVLRRARDLTQFLRLFVMDAKSASGTRVGLDSERVTAEWEQAERARVEQALSDLARHYLSHACGCDAFMQFGTPHGSASQAFATLADHGPELGIAPLFPTPGEDPTAFAERALALLGSLQADNPLRELWNARLERVRRGPRFALPLLEAGAKARAKAAPAELAPWIAGWTECLLERGAVREARALLAQHAALLPRSPRLRCLAAWVLVVCGEGPAGAELLADLRPEELTLPRSLAALRQRIPEWTRYLPGREAPTDGRTRLHSDDASRQSLGASLRIEYRLDDGGEARLESLEAAPGLRQAARQWLAQRPAPHQELHSVEQRCVLEDRICIEHRCESRTLVDAVGGSATLAIALVPLHDERGRVRGWMRLEFEHHLVPSPEYLAHWAQSCGKPAAAAQPVLHVERDAPLREAVFQDCMRALGLESTQRRWWGFSLHGHQPVLVSGSVEGDALLGSGLQPGSALLRAIDAAGHVRFDEVQPGWSVHPESESGLVLQLRFADSTMGLLAIESQRRRDFARLDLARHEEVLSTHALALELAAFREFQRSRHRAEPCFDVHAAGFRRFAERLMRAARRGQCITLCGALGSGRKTLARWVHWLSPARDAELGVQGPESDFEAGALQRLLERHAGSALLFTELERWPLNAQRQLLEWLQEHEGNPRANAPQPIVVMGLSPAQAESRGLLEPALARRLERLCWRVPSLHERRGEILTLFTAVTESLARREQLRVPQWEDDALALLWRQRWQGNLTELESVALRCLLFAPGRCIDAELLARLLREFGIRPLERLPSRHPDRADLLAALSITRLGTGRVNKTRAALYLGWDPDTLVARMQDLGIPQEGPFEILSWGGLDFPVEPGAAALPPDGAA